MAPSQTTHKTWPLLAAPDGTVLYYSISPASKAAPSTSMSSWLPEKPSAISLPITRLRRGGQGDRSFILAAQELSRRGVLWCSNSICQRKWPRPPVSQKRWRKRGSTWWKQGSEQWPRRDNKIQQFEAHSYCCLPVTTYLLSRHCPLFVAGTRDNFVTG